LKVIVVFTRSLWHIIGKKIKYIYLSLYIGKIQTQIFRKLRNCTYLQNKTCNAPAQTQRFSLLGSVTTDRARCYKMLANTCDNKLVEIIITRRSSSIVGCDCIPDVPFAKTNRRLQLLRHSPALQKQICINLRLFWNEKILLKVFKYVRITFIKKHDILSL
jgi:hypothetical protein